MNCPSCDSTGLIDAENIKTKARYFFKCSCVAGKTIQHNLPIWQHPTKGFKIRFYEIENTKLDVSKVMGEDVPC